MLITIIINRISFFSAEHFIIQNFQWTNGKMGYFLLKMIENKCSHLSLKILNDMNFEKISYSQLIKNYCLVAVLSNLPELLRVTDKENSKS